MPTSEIDPWVLDDEPLLEQTMAAAGFTQGPDPGHWHRPEKIGDRIEEVVVDLMVADTFSGPGSRRSGVIPPHSRNATRRTPPNHVRRPGTLLVSNHQDRFC